MVYTWDPCCPLTPFEVPLIILWIGAVGGARRAEGRGISLPEVVVHRRRTRLK